MEDESRPSSQGGAVAVAIQKPNIHNQRTEEQPMNRMDEYKNVVNDLQIVEEVDLESLSSVHNSDLSSEEYDQGPNGQRNKSQLNTL